MERWDGTVLNNNATCADLGPKCLQLLGMHALSGCDTTSYPYGKGRISALNTLLAHDFPGLADVLGEAGTTHAGLMEAAKPFFAVLYRRQLPGTSMESARFNLFPKKKKSPKVMALTPTCYSMCCELICKLCCGKQQTTKDHLMSQPTTLTLGGRSGKAFQFQGCSYHEALEALASSL